jgi:hypothetical protein
MAGQDTGAMLAGAARLDKSTQDQSSACRGARNGARPGQSEVAGSPRDSIDTSIRPADRVATWTPGMVAAGGTPVRIKARATPSPRGKRRIDLTSVQATITGSPFT